MQRRCSPHKQEAAMIPKDPVMLLSYVNTQLRDFYPSIIIKQHSKQSQKFHKQKKHLQSKGCMKQKQHPFQHRYGCKLYQQKNPMVLHIIFQIHTNIYPCLLRVSIISEMPASSMRLLRRLIFTVSVLSSTKSLQSQR